MLINEYRVALAAAVANLATTSGEIEVPGAQDLTYAWGKRCDTQLVAFLNEPDSSSSKVGFRTVVPGLDLLAVTRVSGLMKISDAQRQLWLLMVQLAPLDFTQAWVRQHTLDIWGESDSVAILAACTEPLTRAEAMLAGEPEDVHGVHVVVRPFIGPLGLMEMSEAFNGKMLTRERSSGQSAGEVARHG